MRRLTPLIFMLGFSTFGLGQTPSPINNSSLIPALLPDSQVQLEGTNPASPDWVKTLVMAELRVETATPGGTFASASTILDHYAEMGVNGLWIDPIYDRNNSSQNGYLNYGLQTIYPALTGTTDPAASLQQVAAFVQQAHQRNIRIILDVIVWGTAKDAALVTQHPEFYQRNASGGFVMAEGGYTWDWSNTSFQQWYTNNAVQLIESTGADGFRVDLAPNTSGYFFGGIRNALYADGHKIVVISEQANDRKNTFDFEQLGVTGGGNHSTVLFNNNIVDEIQTGTNIGDPKLQTAGTGGEFRFYTSNLLDHDDSKPFATGSRVRFAYSTIFAPFIPIWWIGEEWNNPKAAGVSVLYFNSINIGLIASNQSFYEDNKQYIRIRRSYPAIFQTFPDSERDANIAKVASSQAGVANTLQAYARFGGGTAILVVPNNGSASALFQVTPGFASIGLNPASSYQVTDLMTGQIVSLPSGQLSNGQSFSTTIASGYLGVFSLTEIGSGMVAGTSLAGPTTAEYGNAVSFTVTAQDSFGSPSAAINGTYPVSISGTATSNASVVLSAGMGSFVLPSLGVGTYNLAVTVAGFAATASITLAQAPLYMTANNVSRPFDSINPMFSSVYSGFVNGDTASVLSGAPPTISTVATRVSPPGTYPITLSGGSLTAANYTVVGVNGSLSVTGLVPQSIIFLPLPNFAQGTTVTLASQSTSGLPVSYTVSGGSVTGSVLSIGAAGTVAVTATQPGNSTYAAAPPVVRSFTAH